MTEFNKFKNQGISLKEKGNLSGAAAQYVVQRDAMKDSCCSKKHNQDECATSILRFLLHGEV